MAQIDFYLCKEEKLKLANAIFGMGLKMIPDLPYETQKLVYITGESEYEPYASKNILMFIVGSNLDDESVVYGTFEKDGKKYFFVRQRYGFVSIDFYSPGLIETAEQRIGPGFLGNYPFYYTREGTKLYPSDESKIVFKELVSFVKRESTAVKLTNRTFWIGKRCAVLCKEAGYQLVNIGDKNLLTLL